MSKILKFSASWCMPCKSLSHNITFLPAEDRVRFFEIDVDAPESKELITKYGIRSVPTLVVLDDDGSVLRIVSGTQSVPKLRELLELA